MKVVLDTNVLVSGIFFSGPPAEILRAWSQAEQPDTIRIVSARPATRGEKKIYDES